MPAFVDHPKFDHGRRTVELDAETARILRAQRAQHLLHRLQVGAGWVACVLVFCQLDGRPYHPDSDHSVAFTLDRYGRLMPQAGSEAAAPLVDGG